MSKIKTVLVVLVSLFLIASGVGCVAVSKMITPADIDPGSVAYVEQAGVAEPNTFEGWPSLAKAELLAKLVDAAHNSIQLVLRQAIETDKLEYSTHRSVAVENVEKGQALENTLFSETGLLSMGLGMLGAGGLTGFLGLMRRKPGDWAPEEVDAALEQAGMESEIKGAQVVELVKWVEQLKTQLPDGVWDVAKKQTVMSDETKKVVAAIKATV